MEPIGITLVIPTFNRAHLIVNTIESALKQTRPFQEIIVVDDCSTDDTLSVLAQYQGRIELIASEKVGVQLARNKGVAAARSPYITLCDSDDLLQADFVETVSEWLKLHPECDSLYTNFQTFNDTQVDKDKFSQAPQGYFDQASRERDFLTDIPDLYGKTVSFQPLFPTGLTTKKSFYQRIGGFNAIFNGVGAEDWEYTLRAVEQGQTALCTKVLTRIRRHTSNDSRNPIHMLMGEITVLEFALANHKLAQQYRDLILSSIDKRRINIFELAFGIKQYVIASKILPLIQKKPSDVKFRIKHGCILMLGTFTRLGRTNQAGQRC